MTTPIAGAFADAVVDSLNMLSAIRDIAQIWDMDYCQHSDSTEAMSKIFEILHPGHEARKRKS